MSTPTTIRADRSTQLITHGSKNRAGWAQGSANHIFWVSMREWKSEEVEGRMLVHCHVYCQHAKAYLKKKSLSCNGMQKQRRQQQKRKKKFSTECRRSRQTQLKKASSSYKPPTLNCYAWYKCFHHLVSLIFSVKMKEKGEQKKEKHKKLKCCSCGIHKLAN